MTVVAGIIVLTCYAFVIRYQAESLLKDVSSLKVGVSTAADAQGVIQRHRRHILGGSRDDHSFATAFQIRNTWLSKLSVEPPSWFNASVAVENGKVEQIGASLFRSMDIFPTFGASAGMVVQDAGDATLQTRPSAHYEFPTPVGKPYLRVELDSYASPVQKQHAFDFSFRCLTKPGWGCDLPCDYLPSAWQDWEDSLKGSSLYPDIFYQHYPKSSRCDSAR
jgi:hypothetical protein